MMSTLECAWSARLQFRGCFSMRLAIWKLMRIWRRRLRRRMESFGWTWEVVGRAADVVVTLTLTRKKKETGALQNFEESCSHLAPRRRVVGKAATVYTRGSGRIDQVYTKPAWAALGQLRAGLMSKQNRYSIARTFTAGWPSTKTQPADSRCDHSKSPKTELQASKPNDRPLSSQEYSPPTLPRSAAAGCLLRSESRMILWESSFGREGE